MNLSSPESIDSLWREGAIVGLDAVAELIRILGTAEPHSSFQGLSSELICGVADELSRRPHTDEGWARLAHDPVVHVGGGTIIQHHGDGRYGPAPCKPPSEHFLTDAEITSLRMVTETARARIATIDVSKARREIFQSDSYKKQKAIEHAHIQWQDEKRICPQCGTSFRAVGDRGQCPNCYHVLHASHPDGDPDWWRKDAEQ